MNTDERMPEMIEPRLDDPRIQAALAELRSMILEKFPDTIFETMRHSDLDGIWLVAVADVDDLDEVTGVVISRTVDMQIDEGLPIYIVGEWPPERIREYLRSQPVSPPIDLADRFPILTA